MCVCVCVRVCVRVCVCVCVCSELQCVPDIWGLMEWADWLTPRNFHVRYDTIFYVCFIETRPHVREDGVEIVDAKVTNISCITSTEFCYKCVEIPLYYEDEWCDVYILRIFFW